MGEVPARLLVPPLGVDRQRSQFSALMATLGWFPLPSISMNGLLGADLPAYAGNMITALHTLVYADDAEAARAFFRDVIGWPHIDAHGGWLIFKTGPSELGVHPASDDRGGETWSTGQHHEISLMCDDIEKTVAELSAKGAEFAGGITARGFGLTTMLRVPGAGEMMLYQPTHPPAHSL